MREKMRLSPKQVQVLTWWQRGDWEAVICDGAVRSGKTFAMGLSFFLWAERCFTGQQFGLCGKTIGALRRNLLAEMTPYLRRLGMTVRERRSENLLVVRYKGHENRFLLFGGRDESSAALIQGSTLAGVLMDETALMPRSFVEQAIARCSVPGSRLWFNCNPEGLNKLSGLEFTKNHTRYDGQGKREFP
jgi:PBSX family phage terminase large subunit